MGGRFGKLATCYWVSAGYVPRFTPPEGSFANFLAQMNNTVLRSRRENFVPRRNGHATRPTARIALPSRNTRAIEISTVLSHDLWWIPTRLAKKIYVGARSKGCYRRENFVPPAVTTSPIDRRRALRSAWPPRVSSKRGEESGSGSAPVHSRYAHRLNLCSARRQHLEHRVEPTLGRSGRTSAARRVCTLLNGVHRHA